MTNLKKQIFSVITAGVMVANIATPAFASTTIEISGNGAGSDNFSTVSQNTTTSVTQTNNANVTNTVNADAKTGGNDANFNTGGDVTIDTGDATVKADIKNSLNSNAAEVNCCAAGSTDVKISGNGANSDNVVALTQNNTTAVAQANATKVNNNVNADAKTGGNDAGLNTGGNVTIKTGAALVDANIATTANVNAAKVGAGLGASNPSASFVISGNGAGSDNFIGATLGKVTSVSQANQAGISNSVDADAKTGENDANFNTGGDVTIDTGDATVKADVDNSVNFNSADVDCGCTWDVLAKITGNGAEDYCIDGINTITLGLTSVQAIGQGNDANLNNDLDDLDAKTGYNDSNSNTGAVDQLSDPTVNTGNALVDTNINNSGNVNTVGDLGWPEMPAVDFSFNFAALWAFFGMSI